MLRIILLLGAGVMLAGCVTTSGRETGLAGECKVLATNADARHPGPILYSSTNKQSRRYAGPALAPDLRARNLVGINLHCPQFRR